MSPQIDKILYYSKRRKIFQENFYDKYYKTTIPIIEVLIEVRL